MFEFVVQLGRSRLHGFEFDSNFVVSENVLSSIYLTKAAGADATLQAIFGTDPKIHRP
jgi:hypothetical protein